METKNTCLKIFHEAMLSTIVVTASAAVWVPNAVQILDERFDTDTHVGIWRIAQAAEVQSFRKVTKMNRRARKGASCFAFEKTGEMFLMVVMIRSIVSLRRSSIAAGNTQREGLKR
jgi:hypothetical protein